MLFASCRAVTWRSLSAGNPLDSAERGGVACMLPFNVSGKNIGGSQFQVDAASLRNLCHQTSSRPAFRAGFFPCVTRMATKQLQLGLPLSGGSPITSIFAPRAASVPQPNAKTRAVLTPTRARWLLQLHSAPMSQDTGRFKRTAWHSEDGVGQRCNW